MSKDLFLPVEYDTAYPPAKAKDKAIVAPVANTPEQAVAIIRKELNKISTGTSDLTPHAIQLKEGSTPFLASLNAFEANPTREQSVELVIMANQDLGFTFGRFVAITIHSIFEGGK